MRIMLLGRLMCEWMLLIKVSFMRSRSFSAPSDHSFLSYHNHSHLIFFFRLRLDEILNGIALVFVVFDVLVGIVAVIIFIRAQRF
jgi:hypothetical protein